MGSINDSSLIAGISNISTISKVNNSTQKLDTSNLSEWQSINYDGNKSFITNNHKNYTKKTSIKFCKELNSYEESISNYVKLKLIYDCLKDIAQDSDCSLEKNIILKLRNLLKFNEINSYINLPNNSKASIDELTLLGIIDLPKNKFTYEEQIEIRSSLETKLREKLHSFITLFENYEGSVNKISKSSELFLLNHFQNHEDLKSLHWMEKIDEVCLGSKKSFESFFNAFRHYNELKSQIHKSVTTNVENLLLQTEVAEMKSIISQLTCTLRLFNETPITVNAYKTLNTTLDEKIINISEEINVKNELKKNYEELKNTEYDGILKKYLEICNIIEKKKKLLEKM